LATTVRAAILTHFVDAARQVGIDPFAALRRAGIDLRALTDPEMRIPSAAAVRLFEDAAAESGCETFALRMGEMRRLSDMGALGLLFAHQPTVRGALRISSSYGRKINEGLIVHVAQAGDVVTISQTLLADDPRPAIQAYELVIAISFRLFRALLGPRWLPISVNFTHNAPRDLNVHRRVFGDCVEFRSEFNGMVLAAADLDRPVPSADPGLAREAERLIATVPNAVRDGTAQQVRRALHILLPLGKATLGHVGDNLGLNERTLQRRLVGEGAQFSDIVCDVRRELAQRYLADPTLPVGQIAQRLGYGQIGSFTRWFVAEFGAPPARWRKDRRVPGS
jgi:AraC-like DNA-binding protein